MVLLFQFKLDHGSRVKYVIDEEMTKAIKPMFILVIVEDYALIREVLLSDNWLDRFEVEWIKEQRSFGKNLGKMLKVSFSRISGNA